MPRWSREPLGLPDRPAFDRTAGAALGTVMTRSIRWAMSAGRETAREAAGGRDPVPEAG
jgi:hypothetical protein